VICDRWDVVAVPFPFTDQPQTKRRPALVLSAWYFNRAGHSVSAMITTKGHRPWPGDAEIQDLEAAGLPRPGTQGGTEPRGDTFVQRCIPRPPDGTGPPRGPLGGRPDYLTTPGGTPWGLVRCQAGKTVRSVGLEPKEGAWGRGKRSEEGGRLKS